MRIMGHSTITVSQRYVHTTPETMENAFGGLEFAMGQADQKVAEESAAVAAVPATVQPVAGGVIQ